MCRSVAFSFDERRCEDPSVGFEGQNVRLSHVETVQK